MVGVTQGAVGSWESGAKEPDLATIERLAKVLEVDPRWLAFGDPQPRYKTDLEGGAVAAAPRPSAADLKPRKRA